MGFRYFWIRRRGAGVPGREISYCVLNEKNRNEKFDKSQLTVCIHVCLVTELNPRFCLVAFISREYFSVTNML